MTLRRAHALLAGLIVLTALVLRVGALERRPLHFDEGNNVYFGLRWPEILALSNDNAEADPPIHRVLLGMWMEGAGPSPFAIRALSAELGMLAVALAWALARALGLGPSGALLLMAGLAISPFHIDYSQEAKGYALVSAAALGSSWAWLKIGRSRRAPAAYVACTLVMLGAHYFSAPLLGMQWLWLLADRARFKREWLKRGLAQALACAPIALWVALAWRGILAGGAKAAGGAHASEPLTVILNLFGEFALGRHAGETAGVIGGVALLLLWLAGLVLARRSPRVFWAGASAGVALLFAVAVEPRLSIFYPRFLLWTLPILLAPIAAVLARPGAARVAAALSLGLAQAWSVTAYYRAPIDAPNDFRPLIADMRPLIQSGDAALGTYIWMDGMWASYAPETRQTLTWVRDFYEQDGRGLDARMMPIAQAHRRVWHLNFNRSPEDPATRSAQWLKTNTAYAGRFSAGALSALLFETAPFAPPTARALFEDRAQIAYTPLRAQARAGDAVRVDLGWMASRPLEDLSIFVHLIGPDGKLVAQSDGDALNGLRPAFTWKPGETIDDPRALLMSAGWAPGIYQVRAGLYQRADGRRLLVADGADFVLIGTIELLQPSPRSS